MSTTASTSGDPTQSEIEAPFLTIEVRTGGGRVHKIEASAGFSAMELMRAAGVPIVADCGGAGVCATCHCRVPDEWAARLPQPTDDEEEKLDSLATADAWSRLSCQIRMDDALDGLVLELQPDSLAGGAHGAALLDAAE